MNRNISTGITSHIALLAHSGGREQQKADDDLAHHRRGERPSACWDPPLAWGQQPHPFWASIPSLQPTPHHQQVGPPAFVGVVWLIPPPPRAACAALAVFGALALLAVQSLRLYLLPETQRTLLFYRKTSPLRREWQV